METLPLNEFGHQVNLSRRSFIVRFIEQYEVSASGQL